MKMRFCFIKTLFIGKTVRDVKEGSVNCKSLYRGPIRELRCEDFLPGNLRDGNIWAPFSWTHRMLRECKSGSNLELQ